VIVNGWDDPEDTFQIDTNGMYTVLKGHQVPEDQIYYLSPENDGDPCVPASIDNHRPPTTFDNVQNAIQTYVPQKIEQSGRSCDEFLLFVSSHGDRTGAGSSLKSILKVVTDKVCGPDDNPVPYGGVISPEQLNGWLAEVPCDRVTVVLEACHSGGFVDELKNSPNPNLPQQRFVFASTSPAGESHADVDSTEDPNPGDAGSETIWGYIEAFGMSAADFNPEKREISFGEAVKYAVDNDVTQLNGTNSPQMHPAIPWLQGLPQSAAHWCYRGTGQPDLDVPLTRDSDAGPAGSDPFTPRMVEVGNTGYSALSVGTLRFFEPDPMEWQRILNLAGGPAAPPETIESLAGKLQWPDDFTQVGNTRLVWGIGAGTTRWYRVSRAAAAGPAGFPARSLLLVVDSPQDPLTAGSLRIETLLVNDNNVGTTAADR
jgi:hypothetical protein